MDKEIDHLIEYFSLLQVMATAGKTHAAIIQCLGILADNVDFKDNAQKDFLESLKIAMADSQETLKQIEKAEIRINKRHNIALSGMGKISVNH